LGSGDHLDHNAKCGRRSGFGFRRAEVAVLIGVIDAASPRPHLAAWILASQHRKLGASSTQREIGFYREFAADYPVHTPMCYFGGVEMESGASLLLLEDLSWMHNLKSAGGSVDEAERVIREIGRLHAAWWGDARLDKTPWLQMKGMMTPHEAPLVFTQNWERFLDKLSIPVQRADLGGSTLCALPASHWPSRCTLNLREH
jgi:hypothetical protein